MLLIRTMTSVHLIDPEEGTVTRYPQHDAPPPAEDGPPVSDLPSDGVALPLVAVGPLAVGAPTAFIVMHDDGPQVRTTTMVVSIEEVSADADAG